MEHIQTTQRQGSPEDDPEATGYEGDDWIDGGAGKDTADYSESENSITVTLSGDNERTLGELTIKVADGVGGTDTLASIEKLILSDDKDTVLVRPFGGGRYYNSTGDATTIDMGGEPDAAKDNLAAGDTLDFSQYGRGVYLKRSGSSDLFYAATASSDILRGGRGPDTYIFGYSIGHDVIDDVEPALTSQVADTLRFAQLRPDDLTATRDDLDLILTVNATGETITVLGQFVGQRPGLFGGNIIADQGVGEIIFADGAVWGRIDIARAVSHPQETSDTLMGTPTLDFLDGARATIA